MANVTLSIQSLLNAAVFDSFTVDNAITIATLKTTIQTAKGFDATWFDLFYNGALLNTAQTIASYGITTGTVLMTGNKIANLSTKQAKQTAKLALAGLKRVADGKARVTLDITQLPTQYNGDGITDNPNVDGLIQGRPWIATIPFTVTEHIDLDGFTITETNVGPLTLEAKSSSYQVQPPVDGYIKVNGTTIKTTNLAANSRGHTLAVISPAGATVGSIVTYDTFGAPADQIAIVSALNAVASGNYIVLASWDACAVNASMRSSLTNNYGAPTPSPFSTWVATRYSHIFIGKKI